MAQLIPAPELPRVGMFHKYTEEERAARWAAVAAQFAWRGRVDATVMIIREQLTDEQIAALKRGGVRHHHMDTREATLVPAPFDESMFVEAGEVRAQVLALMLDATRLEDLLADLVVAQGIHLLAVKVATATGMIA